MYKEIPTSRLVAAFVIATLVATRGLKKGSLDKSGAASAFIVGFIALSTSWTCGILLLAFYFTGSAFTKYKAQIKQKYDLESSGGEGNRNWMQVFATAGFGTVLCIILWLIDVDTLQPYIVYGWGKAVAMGDARTGWASALLLAYIGNYAMVCGDTWASELGILSQNTPILVTPLFCCRIRRVPRGTNGGISAWGTLMSVAGGAFIGLVFWLCYATAALLRGVAFSSAVLYGGQNDVPLNVIPLPALVVIGAAAGFVGSLIDSVIGAVLQRSWVHEKSGKATSRLPHDINTSGNNNSGKGDSTAANISDFKVVCGYDILSNEQVNLLSAGLTSVLTALALAWAL